MVEPRHGLAPLLTTEGLSKNFGGVHAVRDVSLSLSAGELHAVIGPNGAGKSTLVNLLSGEVRPSAGSIRLGGQDVSALAVHSRVHAGIARSYQRTNIFATMTVLENVRLAAQAVAAPLARLLRPASGEVELVEMAMTAIERTGLAGLERRTAGTLSHGAQRQLEIAMTLASRPKVILLDEPLAGMGQEEGERIAALLRTLAAERAVLLIEHDMDFVFQVADWMTVMVNGEVLAAGTPSAVRANEDVQRAYLGGHA